MVGTITKIGMFDNTGMLACKAYVYLIVAHDPQVSGDIGYVKIGQSRSPLERAASIKTGCPVPFVRFTLIQANNQRAAYELEQALLAKFSDRQSQGEWVRICWGNLEAKKEFFKDVALVIKDHIKKPKVTEINPAKIVSAADVSRELRKFSQAHPSW